MVCLKLETVLKLVNVSQEEDSNTWTFITLTTAILVYRDKH